MPDSETAEADSGRASQYRVLAMMLFLLIGAPILLFAIVGWINAPFSRAKNRVYVAIEELSRLRPPEYTPSEWEHLCDCAYNANGNCFFSREFLQEERSVDEFTQFADEFERRVQAEGGMETINWFWDQVEELSSSGEKYSYDYRPTVEHLEQCGQYDLLDKLRKADAGGTLLRHRGEPPWSNDD